MKLSTLYSTLAFTGAMSLLTLSVIAADVTPDNAMGATPQAATPNEGVSPNMSGMPGAPEGVPNAMGASDKSAIDINVLDSNKDGSITMGEYLKFGGTSESFRQSDKNNDNKLDSSELMTQ